MILATPRPSDIAGRWSVWHHAILEERRIRHFTIPQLQADYGDDWAARQAYVRQEADRAADSLLELVDAVLEALNV